MVFVLFIYKIVKAIRDTAMFSVVCNLRLDNLGQVEVLKNFGKSSRLDTVQNNWFLRQVIAFLHLIVTWHYFYSS